MSNNGYACKCRNKTVNNKNVKDVFVQHRGKKFAMTFQGYSFVRNHAVRYRTYQFI